MTLEELKASIRSKVIEILTNINPDEDYEALQDDAPFRDQLDMDSMDMLDIVLELRREYKVPIPEADYPRLSTMNSTIDYLIPLVQSK